MSVLPIWLVDNYFTQERVKVTLNRAIKKIESSGVDDLIDIEAIGPRQVTSVLLGIFKENQQSKIVF